MEMSKKAYYETIERILKGSPSKEEFREFILMLIRIDNPQEQAKICAQASPILSTWHWEQRYAGGWSWAYDITQIPGLMELIGHLELRLMDGSESKDLNKFILSPQAMNLRGLTLLKIEEIPQYFYHLTRSPYLCNLEYLQLRAIDLSDLDVCLGGEALVNLKELVIWATINYREEADFLKLPVLKTLKRLFMYFHLGPDQEFLLNMMQASCWHQLERFDLYGKSLSREKVDFMIANWVHPGPRRLCIQGTPAANEPNPAWAAYGIEWEGESKM